MPGLNTIIKFIGSKTESPERLADLLKSMNFDKTYFPETIYEDGNTSIFFSGYQGYPRQRIDFDGKSIIIEGAIYNKSSEQVKAELTRILPPIAAAPAKTDALRDFMFSTDGEFVIYFIDKALSTVLIFNDALGRLPTYFHSGKDSVIIARVMKFLVGFEPNLEFDRNSLMEYFLYAAALGDHTFYKNVFRLLPCTFIAVDYKTRQVSRQTLYAYNFDDRHEDRPLKEYVKNLHDLFMAGVANRAARFPEKKQILTLSGGLDSRTNLMALLKNKVKFYPLTFRDYYNFLRRDYPVVKQLDKTYNLNLKAYRLIEDNIPYFERMVWAKDGHSIMGSMGGVLNSMEIIENEYGKDCAVYTGDEGNYITAPRYGGGKIDSTPELVRQIHLKNSLSIYSFEEVARIFGKQPSDVIDYLCDYYSRYPEKDNIHKVDHFFIFERSFKFTMEGQDRTRLFFWPMAPHYSIQYARYAFQIKNKYLNGWKIYRGLLRSLDAQSTKIKYGNFGIALDSPLMPIYLPLRALATSNETVRRNLIQAIRLAKNPLLIGSKTKEREYIGQLEDYVGDLMSPAPGID